MKNTHKNDGDSLMRIVTMCDATEVDQFQSKNRTSSNDDRKSRNIGKFRGVSSNIAAASGGVGQHITKQNHTRTPNGGSCCKSLKQLNWCWRNTTTCYHKNMSRVEMYAQVLLNSFNLGELAVG